MHPRQFVAHQRRRGLHNRRRADRAKAARRRDGGCVDAWGRIGMRGAYPAAQYVIAKIPGESLIAGRPNDGILGDVIVCVEMTAPP